MSWLFTFLGICVLILVVAGVVQLYKIGKKARSR